MKKPILFATLCASAVVSFGQTSTDENEGSRLAPNLETANTFDFSWFGRAGRTYFVQHTDDLTTSWNFLPVVESGAEDVLSYSVFSTAPRTFLRLRYTDVFSSNPRDEDFDGDGVSNWDEVSRTLDPFGNVDSDGDGMPDDWERAMFGDLTRTATADADGDGVSNFNEYLAGTDPIYIISNVSLLSPTGTDWTTTNPAGVVLKDGYLRLKINVSPQFANLETALARPKFGKMDITLNGTERPVSLTANNTSIFNSGGTSELRVALSYAEIENPPAPPGLFSLMALNAFSNQTGLTGGNDDDTALEKASFDAAGPNFPGASLTSNLDDSNAFFAQYRKHGSSNLTWRGRASGVPTEVPPDLTAMQAAGWRDMKVRFPPSPETDINTRSEDQADFFYISCHGFHETGTLYEPDITPEAMMGKWNRDLDVVIIAGCSILDVSNPNNRAPSANYPGQRWSKTGPALFLGYNALAPADNGGVSTAIITDWNDRHGNGEYGDDDGVTYIATWMAANYGGNRLQTNACAIKAKPIGQAVFHYFRVGRGSIVQTLEESSWPTP